jgi:hypothetical protein
MVMSGHELHEIARISKEEASSPHPSPPKGEEREMTFSFLHVVPMFRRLSKSRTNLGRRGSRSYQVQGFNARTF